MITIEKFLDAWNKFTPSKIERFYFKHFSTTHENKNLSWIVISMLTILFLTGFIGTIVNANDIIIRHTTLVLAFMLLTLGIPWIYVWYAHRRRIKKIIKELDCTLDEYKKAVEKWGNLIK